jgi:hypothetical protein
MNSSNDSALVTLLGTGFFVLLAVYIVWMLARAVLTPSRRATLYAGAAALSLDTVLLYWTPKDPLTLRDLLNGGLVILGRPGSGKSSSSSELLLQACVDLPQSGGLILAAAPDDLVRVKRIFAKHPGRLIIFDETSNHCFNVLNFVMARGGSTKDILAAINAIAETVGRGGGGGGDGDDGSFFSKGGQRILENSIIVVKHATGRASPADLLQFVNTAPSSINEVHSEEFTKTFHYQCMKEAFEKEKSPVESFDFDLAMAFFTIELPKMADRTRTSLIATCTNSLHLFNTGLNRQLFATVSTVTPEVMDQHKWIFVNMPISRVGEEGAFSLGVFKWATEFHVMRRDSGQDNRPLFIHADEIHNIINKYDTRFLGECRKFGGCMIACTQSRASFLANMRGDASEAQVDALLNNFTHKIIHALGDVESARWVSDLVGESIQFSYSVSERDPDSLIEAMLGPSVWTGSLGEDKRPLMFAREFMYGFRTGGKRNRNICDAVLIRSGELFSNGQGFLKLEFKQPETR